MAFTFKLELADGTPADPPTFKTVAWSWRAGDTIPLGYKTLPWSTFATTSSTRIRCWLSRTCPNERLTWSEKSSGTARVGCPLGPEQRMARSSDGGSD